MSMVKVNSPVVYLSTTILHVFSWPTQSQAVCWNEARLGWPFGDCIVLVWPLYPETIYACYPGMSCGQVLLGKH